MTTSSKELHERYFSEAKKEYTLSGRNYVNEKINMEFYNSYAEEFIQTEKKFNPDVKGPNDISQKLCNAFAKRNGLKKDVLWKIVEKIKQKVFKQKV